jgi:mono/diheme cytochrome c family protein
MTCLVVIALALLAQDPPPERPTDVPTWDGEVASIIRTHCSGCHAAGGPGPFPLERHEDLARRSQFIKHVLSTGLMPPWLPSHGLPIRDDRTIPTAQLAILEAWIDAGAPKSDPIDAETPAPPSTSVSPEAPEGPSPAGTDTSNGVHEAVMRAPWQLPAEGGARWFKAERDKRTFVLPLGNDRPLRIRSIDYTTEAPLALAATAFAADATGQARRMVDWDEEPGSYMMGDIGFVAAGSLGVVGPGGGRLDYPDGFHVLIPADSDLVSEVHFRPQGRSWTLSDRLQLEECTAGPGSRQLVPVNVMVRKIELAPDETKAFHSDLVLPMAVDLVAITPRASRRCRSMEVRLVDPVTGRSRVILGIDDWNPHYRETLVLESPLRLEKGAVVEVSWQYDNSAGNPRNPVIPPERVSLGARVGSANVLLMCAPVDPEAVAALSRFAADELRRRQR